MEQAIKLRLANAKPANEPERGSVSLSYKCYQRSKSECEEKIRNYKHKNNNKISKMYQWIETLEKRKDDTNLINLVYKNLENIFTNGITSVASTPKSIGELN